MRFCEQFAISVFTESDASESCRTFSSVTRWTKLAIRPTQYIQTQ